MKRVRFTEEQIIAVLREHEAGAKTGDLARKHGVSEATLYNWKAKYGGLEVSENHRFGGVVGHERASWRVCRHWIMKDCAILEGSTPITRQAKKDRSCLNQVKSRHYRHQKRLQSTE